jgi:hypothetical protein
MNVFGFNTLDAIMGLIQFAFWGVILGLYFGLVRYILFNMGLRNKPWNARKGVSL